MKNNYFLWMLVLLTSISFAQSSYTDGVFVVNEGNMGTDKASVSFIKNGAITNDVFSLANNDEVLGDVLQNLLVHQNIGILALNASNKLVVVNATTFEKTHTITEGIHLPRYGVVVNNKAYVTNWGSDSFNSSNIAVVNLQNFTVESSILLDHGANRIFEKNGKLYILHPGAFGVNEKMTTYDLATQEKTEYVVGVRPENMVFVGDYAYIAIGGDFMGGVSSLVKFNLLTAEMSTVATFGAGISLSHMAGLNQTLYLSLGKDIYTFNTATDQLNSQVMIETDITTWGGAYGMNLLKNELYVADAGNYVNDGEVTIYNLQGELLNTYEAGNIPNAFVLSPTAKAAIHNPNQLQLSVYPNPVADRLYLTTDKTTTYQLHDMLGKKLLQGTYTSQGIEVNHLAKGTYMLQVNQSGATQTIRFIKK